MTPNADLDSFDTSYIDPCVLGRKLFVTDDSYLGLAPEEAQPGDEVSVLLGCSVPMLLRPTDNGCYQVVGETYVQGLMDSEALLGPLGEDWLVKESIDTEGFTCRRFHSVQTGKASKYDPRLAGVDLPDGWKTLRHDKEDFYDKFHHADSRRTTQYDPRLSSESLKKRGVDLQTLALI